MSVLALCKVDAYIKASIKVVPQVIAPVLIIRIGVFYFVILRLIYLFGRGRIDNCRE